MIVLPQGAGDRAKFSTTITRDERKMKRGRGWVLDAGCDAAETRGNDSLKSPSISPAGD
jgi:hypothetical protein